MAYELYPAFKHWMPTNGNIWFYSDPHFGDKENWLLRKQFIRAIDNVEAFDNLQITTINKTCGKNDTLVILGDVGDIEYVKKLRAKKKSIPPAINAIAEIKVTSLLLHIPQICNTVSNSPTTTSR